MKLKKFLAAALVATMVMSSALTVCADYDDSSESETVTVPEDVQVSNAPIEVAGSTVKTSVAGVYASKSVQGTAVTTPITD